MTSPRSNGLPSEEEVRSLVNQIVEGVIDSEIETPSQTEVEDASGTVFG